jgi:Tol biopolymer transport system component
VRLGDGVYGALSPDGKWVLSLTQYREGSRMRLIVLPTGAGETRQLTRGDSDVERNSFGWLPDSSAVVYGAGEEGSVRMYLLPPDGGEAQAISAEGVVGSLVTPDGKQLVARGPRGWLLCPLAGGTTQPIRGIDPSWSVLGWDLDGKRLRVVVSSLDPLSVFLLNPATGDKQPWKRVTRSASLDRAGLVSMTLPRFSRNGKSYAYHYHRQLSDLYVVDGLR